MNRQIRKEYLHEYVDPDLQLESFELTGETAAGIELGTSKYVMQNKPSHEVNEQWKQDFKDALALGFLFIRSLVPQFGSMVQELNLPGSIYKPISDEECRLIQGRFTQSEKEHDSHSVGMGYARELVANTLEIPKERVTFPSLAAESNSKVIAAVAEWIDGLVVCSHYAYQHDFLCSLDEGGGLGTKSVMHSANVHGFPPRAFM